MVHMSTPMGNEDTRQCSRNLSGLLSSGIETAMYRTFISKRVEGIKTNEEIAFCASKGVLNEGPRQTGIRGTSSNTSPLRGRHVGGQSVG